MIANKPQNFSTGIVRVLISIFIGIAIFVAAVVGTYHSLTKPYPGHNDFLSRWEGARSYWVDGLNPYSEEASLNIQVSIYGRPTTETEDPGYFAYPFYTVFLLLPIVGISYAWAAAIWMVLLETCLIAALFLMLNQFQWRPSPLVLGVLILWTLMSYFPARGLILGQPGLLVYFLEVLTIWALGKKYDRTAGVALALSTLKPQMGYLFVPLLGLWGLRQKRWRFVISAFISFAILMIASFIAQPSWLTDWLDQISRYTSYTALGGPVWIISNWLWLGIDPKTGLWGVSGGFGGQIELVLSSVLYLYLLWNWYVVLVQNRRERFMWTIVMTLAITHLVAPRTATPHYVVFMIPMLFYFRWLTSTYRRGKGSIYSILILFALFVGQWAHFLLTVDGEFEHPTVYLPVPILMFFLLIWTRRLWWQDQQGRFQQGEITE